MRVDAPELVVVRVEAPELVVRVVDAVVAPCVVAAGEALRVVEAVAVRVVDAGTSVRVADCLGDANWRALLTSVPA